MKLFRLQHKETIDGMWTVEVDGKKVVDHLSDKRLAKMPMPFSDRFRYQDKIWRCSVNSFDNLAGWFTLADVQEMLDMNFHVIEFDNDDFIIEQYQILYNEKTSKNKKDITDKLVSYYREKNKEG